MNDRGQDTPDTAAHDGVNAFPDLPAAGSLRRRRKTRTRDRILSAALTLIEARGFADTTVDAITALAGVAKGTFFNYFASKDELLVTYAERLNDEAAEALERLCERDGQPHLHIRQAFEVLVRIVAREGHNYETLAREILARPALLHGTGPESARLIAAYEQVVERGVADGTLRPDLDIRETANLLCDIWTSTASRWIASNQAFDLGCALRTRVDLLVAGLAKDDGY